MESDGPIISQRCLGGTMVDHAFLKFAEALPEVVNLKLETSSEFGVDALREKASANLAELVYGMGHKCAARVFDMDGKSYIAMRGAVNAVAPTYPHTLNHHPCSRYSPDVHLSWWMVSLFLWILLRTTTSKQLGFE